MYGSYHGYGKVTDKDGNTEEGEYIYEKFSSKRHGEHIYISFKTGKKYKRVYFEDELMIEQLLQ